MKQKSPSETVFLTDEKIVELYWQRNEAAITATDNKYGHYLYTIAYNIVNNRLDCEECLNDTYLNTWNAIPPKRPSLLSVFLSKIIRNLALDRFRKNHASKRIPSEFIVSLNELDDCLSCTKTVEEEYLIKEVVRILNEYLRTLSDRQTYIFVWRYYQGESVKKIAHLLNMSEATIRRELTSIRLGLKECLAKEGFDYEV